MLHVDEDELQDEKFKQYWTKKLRRQSSEDKTCEGDKLCIRENSKFTALMTRNCEQTSDWNTFLTSYVARLLF